VGLFLEDEKGMDLSTFGKLFLEDIAEKSKVVGRFCK
jgi:hypothetical protein